MSCVMSCEGSHDTFPGSHAAKGLLGHIILSRTLGWALSRLVSGRVVWRMACSHVIGSIVHGASEARDSIPSLGSHCACNVCIPSLEV